MSRERRRVGKLRISLLSAILLLTIASLGGALYHSWRANTQLRAEFAPLNAENERLRAEQGALTITDREKVHAIRLPDMIEQVWQYRVYLPPGRDYYVAAQPNRLPRGEALQQLRFSNGGGPPDTRTVATGMSAEGAQQSGIGQKAGEITVTLRIYRDDNGKKAFTLSSGPIGRQKTAGFAIPSEENEWPAIEDREPKRGEPSPFFSRSGVPTGRQVTSAADQLPLVLMDYRVAHSGMTSTADSDEGIVVWVGRADENQKEVE